MKTLQQFIVLLLCAILVGGCATSKTDSLINKLNSNDQRTRDKAEEDLKAMGPVVTDPLIAVLSNEKAPQESRQRAARILGELKAEKAIPVLITSLSNIRLRLMAQNALKKIGAPALDPLMKST